MFAKRCRESLRHMAEITDGGIFSRCRGGPLRAKREVRQTIAVRLCQATQWLVVCGLFRRRSIFPMNSFLSVKPLRVLFCTVFAASFVLGPVVSRARADEWDKKTVL